MADQRRHLVVGTYALLAAMAVWVLHPGGVGGALIAPLLLCPGYAVVCACDDGADSLASAVLTVALSFAVAALGGLVLHAVGAGLTERSWSALMAIVTVAGLVAAERRRSPGTWRVARVRFSLTRPAAATAALTCVVLLLAGVIAVRSEHGVVRSRSTTQLGVVAGGGTMQLSVVNAESAAARYQLRIASAAGAEVVPLRLAPGQKWSASRPRPSGPVTVRLFRVGHPRRPYRIVHLGQA